MGTSGHIIIYSTKRVRGLQRRSLVTLDTSFTIPSPAQPAKPFKLSSSKLVIIAFARKNPLVHSVCTPYKGRTPPS